MKKTFISLLLLLTLSLILPAKAMMQAPPWYVPPAPAGDYQISHQFGMVSFDPNDTNNYSTNFTAILSGMYVTPVSSNTTFCVGSVNDSVSYANTNLVFGGRDATLLDWPQQTQIASGQTLIALFPESWAKRSTNTPIFDICVWQTFTNTGYTYTNTTTVYLPAGHGVYASVVTCTNLNDWTNCFPVPDVSGFTNIAFTSTNLWYPPTGSQTNTPNNFAYWWMRMGMAVDHFVDDFGNWITGTQFTLSGTPNSNWQLEWQKATHPEDGLFQAPPVTWDPVLDGGGDPVIIAISGFGRGGTATFYPGPPGVLGGAFRGNLKP